MCIHRPNLDLNVHIHVPNQDLNVHAHVHYLHMSTLDYIGLYYSTLDLGVGF